MKERVEFTSTHVRLVGDRWSSHTGPCRGLLLFLHGGGQTRNSWRRTAANFAERGWTTISLDARGHGESAWAPDGDYSMDAMVSDLRTVLRQLPEQPVLVGASLGGMSSLLTEGEHPGSARAIVLVDVLPRLEPEGVARIQAFMTARPNGFANLQEVAEAVQAYTPDRKRSVSFDGLKKNLRHGRDGRWYWHWDPAFMTAGEEPRRGVDEKRLRDAARSVTVPTLAVRGLQSDVVSQRGIDELLEVLPHARTVDIGGAGHMVVGDDNDVFTAHLAEFLQSDVEVSGT